MTWKVVFLDDKIVAKRKEESIVFDRVGSMVFDRGRLICQALTEDEIKAFIYSYLMSMYSGNLAERIRPWKQASR